MPKMIATKAQTYDRRTIEAGEEFEVPDAYVGTLQSLGRATVKDQKSTKVEPTKTAEPEAEDKKYKTRRLKADDSD